MTGDEPVFDMRRLARFGGLGLNGEVSLPGLETMRMIAMGQSGYLK